MGGLPNVLGEAVFDKLLVLVLVEAHEYAVISSLWTGFEVEHHGCLLVSASNECEPETEVRELGLPEIY